MKGFSIRPLEMGDREWVARFMAEQWGADLVVVHGMTCRPSDLPGLVAVQKEHPIGLVTFHIEGEGPGSGCEIVTLNSIKAGIGVGTALIEAVREMAGHSGCRRLWLVTTNDNLDALRFYQKRGFRLVAIRPNALEESRRIKPQIPLIGNDGIPLRDEIELEMRLEVGRS